MRTIPIEIDESDYERGADGRWVHTPRIVRYLKPVTWPTWTRKRERIATQIVRSYMGEGPLFVNVYTEEDNHHGPGTRPMFEVSASRGGPTDEGWTRTTVTVTVEEREDGDVFVAEIHTAGRDCDGPSSHTQTAYLRPSKRRARRFYPSRGYGLHPTDRHSKGRFMVRFPFVHVEETKATQRDHFAEAAGY
jgi:hypothetical protein